MTSVLESIVRSKRAEVGRLRPWASALRQQAEAAEPARDLAGALRGSDIVSVIAEVKRKSPSAGWISRDLNAAGQASVYVHGGASAISVLTDEEYFGGSREDLEAAKSAVEVPVLRKDFVIDPVQVHEARSMGADAVLLIVRILEGDQLSELVAVAGELGMAALVEAHDGAELDRALTAGAAVIGINNRDLTSFETDLGVAESLAPRVPGGVVLVGESGIHDPADVDRLGAAGVDAVLIGESLVRSPDPVEAVARLAGRARDATARGAAS